MQQNQTLSLKDFVKTTLLEINESVVEASEEGLPLAYRRADGLAISVVNLNFGKEKKNASEHLTTNRIKFSVDMFLGLENTDDNDQ
ncbi:MAG: hypothetical protein LBQ77_08820 [Treponema sp.]|nr:hypothetical protein [Treponema sp.]